MMNRKWLMPMTACVLALALAGCQKEGPAEEAGKKIDEAMETAKEETKAMADEVGIPWRESEVWKQRSN